jgi:hypothetical protein
VFRSQYPPRKIVVTRNDSIRPNNGCTVVNSGFVPEDTRRVEGCSRKASQKGADSSSSIRDLGGEGETGVHSLIRTTKNPQEGDLFCKGGGPRTRAFSVQHSAMRSVFANGNSLRLIRGVLSLLQSIPLIESVQSIRMPKQVAISVSLIEKRILQIRGQRVMLSTDLAVLYEVQPKVLIQAVKRNAQRFPDDFMFRLTPEETQTTLRNALRSRSQIVTLKRGQNVKYSPYAFTEQGVSMLSSVLRSRRAIQVNIAIMRAFVRLREIFAAHKDLARQLDSLEREYETHDRQVHSVFEAIRQLMSPEQKPKQRIGF